jgi:lipopolysaccharide biosynthesis glycosyltransferase
MAMRQLVYYTVGYSSAYIDVLGLSVRSLRASGYSGDIAVLCDESMLSRCKDVVGPGAIYHPFANAKTPEQASMNKLRIFELPTIESYDRILFLDSDILVHMNVEALFEKIVTSGILYVYTETRKIIDHMNIMWGLKDYTPTELESFRSNDVYVFNAGCFAFLRTDAMRDHFMAIQYSITTHTGAFFYEQSFMNAHFNRNNQTDRSLLTDSNYAFPPKDNTPYPGCLVHFAGDPGSGASKHERMTKYTLAYLRS